MCGIAGLLGPRADLKRVDRMCAHLVHRGPDGTRTWRSPGVALGHTRLAVVDRSPAGAQPMWTPDGRWGIVYNGEIYGYRALRIRLAGLGHVFDSDTDTEVVLQAWSEWGPSALDRMDGMFAFGLWDRRDRRLYLVRDRLGIKPLYWHRAPDGTLAFASEVRALLASGVPTPRVDRGVLPAFLSQQTTPTPSTLLDGVRMLPAASILEVEFEGEEVRVPAIRAYWNPLARVGRAGSLNGGRAPGSPRTDLRERLMHAVGGQLLADVPLGAFLSGGVDSSLIVALMSRASPAPVRTFSVAFEDPAFEDGPYARVVAERFGTHHREVRLSDQELVELLPRAVAAQDHPSGNGINTWVVSRAARHAGLTVALSGIGGDELFGGYPSFRRLALLHGGRPLLGALPRSVRTAWLGFWRTAGFGGRVERMAELMGTDGSVAEAYPTLREVFAPARAGDLLRGGGRAAGDWERPYTERLRIAESTHPSLGLLARVSHAEMTCYMQDVLLRDADQMSMAHSLEIRVPFLDRRLVEYALGLPEAARRPSSPPKRFLVRSFEDVLPDPVRRRPKQGFAMPFDRWMRGPLRRFCQDGIDALADHPAFDGDGAQRVWRQFLLGKRGWTWSRPWLLVVLGRWVERVGAR